LIELIDGDWFFIDPLSFGGVKMNKFERELVTLINRHCMENDSDTPDYMLAEYIVKCLEAFNQTVKRRERWYGRDPIPITFIDPADNPIEKIEFDFNAGNVTITDLAGNPKPKEVLK
jgi:hypothetical protein